MSIPPPAGVYVPAVLFFDENEEFDIASIKAHILRLAQGGVTGILVQGSNGEAQHLSHEERKEAIVLTRKTLDENGFQNVLVIAGTGGQSTRETKKLCADAHEAGALYALVLTPSTWRPQMTEDAILRFHREVADASPIPITIYNFPTVTAGLDLDSDIISVLAQHPNIVGTKLSCGNIGKLQRLTSRLAPSHFAVFSGKSDAYLHGLNAGSAGTIAALVNIAPKLHTKLFKLWEEGNTEAAMDLQARLGQADWATSKIGGIGGIKAVVSKHFGYGQSYVRGPLKVVDTESFSTDKHYQTLVNLITAEKNCEL